VAGAFLCLAVLPARAGPDIEDLDTTGIEVTATPEQIRWGDQIDIEVTAVNSTGAEVEGGLLVSFDQDVLILEAPGGRILRPGDRIFNMKSLASVEIKQPMVELWLKNWKAGTQQVLKLTVLPLRVQQLRVRARASFLQRTAPPKLYIAPGRMNSRSLDEGGFPSAVAYVEVSSKTNFRRAIRRLERNIRGMDEDGKRLFAAAIADMLEDPKSLTALSGSGDEGAAIGALAQNAPYITARLRGDPVVSLDKLRCIMASLECSSGLVYFGMPMAMFEQLSIEEALERDAKELIASEMGSDNFLALLDAEGLTLRKSKDAAIVTVSVNNIVLSAGPDRPFVLPLLKKIVDVLGSDAAKREHKGVKPPSFSALFEQLSAPKAN
jgi:hypothetical protein